MTFFAEPQGAAVLKHTTIDHYAYVFANKTGKWSRENTVTVLDGYAGPGRYDDGSAGSPEYFVTMAKKLAGKRKVRCICVEKDPASYAKLVTLLGQIGAGLKVQPEAVCGRIEDHLDSLLERVHGEPLLAFLDPYGLSIPFDELTGKLMARPPRVDGRICPTEVLLNFSVKGIERAGGRLDEEYTTASIAKGRDTRLANMNAFLGGIWWHELWMGRRPGERVEAILNRYVELVCRSAEGWKPLVIPVRDRYYNGPISYYLVLFTRNDQGLWFFNNSASLGAEALHNYTEATSGELVLMPPDMAERWVDRLAGNLAKLLEQHARVELGTHTAELYGDLIGLARETHLREAVELLHGRGVTSTHPKGVRELHKLIVEVTPPSPPEHDTDERLYGAA